jgi:hypothetical protein
LPVWLTIDAVMCCSSSISISISSSSSARFATWGPIVTLVSEG